MVPATIGRWLLIFYGESSGKAGRSSAGDGKCPPGRSCGQNIQTHCFAMIYTVIPDNSYLLKFLTFPLTIVTLEK